MYDFLTRLVERTQGKVQVAQPVIPPMYASVSNSLSDHSEYSLRDSEPVSVPIIPNRVMVYPPANDPSSATLNQSFQRTSGMRFAPHRQVEPVLSEQLESAFPQEINDQTEYGIIEHSSNPASPENLPDIKPQKEDFSDNNDLSTNKIVPEYDQNTRIVAEKPLDTKRDVSGNDVGTERLIAPRNLPDAEKNQNIGQRYEHPGDKKRDISWGVIKTEPVSPIQESLQSEQSLNEKKDAPKEPIYFDRVSASRKKTDSTEVRPVKTPHLNPRSPGNIRLQKDAETEPTSSESTIKVTIGRVEVRAIMPAVPCAPAKRANSQGPILSLNDYLKQRNEGKR